MSNQEYINILGGIVSFFGGWLLKEVWESLKELRVTDQTMLAKVNSLEVVIVGQYVKKDDLEKILKTILEKLDGLESLEILMADKYAKKDEVSKLGEAIFRRFDRIEEKLDSKADKE
jgi:hypothetical protein